MKKNESKESVSVKQQALRYQEKIDTITNDINRMHAQKIKTQQKVENDRQKLQALIAKRNQIGDGVVKARLEDEIKQLREDFKSQKQTLDDLEEDIIKVNIKTAQLKIECIKEPRSDDGLKMSQYRRDINDSQLEYDDSTERNNIIHDLLEEIEKITQRYQDEELKKIEEDRQEELKPLIKRQDEIKEELKQINTAVLLKESWVSEINETDKEIEVLKEKINNLIVNVKKLENQLAQLTDQLQARNKEDNKLSSPVEKREVPPIIIHSNFLQPPPLQHTAKEEELTALQDNKEINRPLQDEVVSHCEHGDLNAVQMAIHQGACVNLPDSQGRYPVSAAVFGMNVEIIKFLLSQASNDNTMKWEDIEQHNLRHYGRIFMVPKFHPNYYRDCLIFLQEIKQNSFLCGMYVNIHNSYCRGVQFNLQTLMTQLAKEGPLQGHKTRNDLTICDAKASWVETEAAYANCRNQIRLLIQEHYILLLKRLSLLEEQKAEIQELNLVNMRDAEAQQIKTNKSEQGISNIANTLPFFQKKQQNFEKKQENVETGHSKCINALVELPDKRLASASHDGKIKLWDLESGQCTTTLEGHTEYVYSLTVFSDGRLVSHSHDGTLRFWDLQTGKSTITSIRGNILSPIAALKNELLVTCQGNSEIQLWDVRTEKIVKKLQYEKTLLGHTSYIHASSEKYLVGCNPKAVTLWNLETGQCEITISHDNAYYTPMRFSAPIILPDKQHLAAFVSQYGVGYGISVWDVTGKRGVRKFNLATSVNGKFLEAFSHEHRTYLVCAGHVGYHNTQQQLIEIWCVDTKECLKKIVIPEHPKIRCLTLLTGQRFATGDSSGETRIWNAITGNCEIILQRNSEVDRDCVKELSTAKEYRPG